ncbi:MAG: tetratricopeptide repeat protein [Ignavibacteriae bacterium]|nr:tetratricopeptide repeat protein [Ignavibacteriota bacterium]
MPHSDSAVIVLTKSIEKYEKGLAEFYQARSMNYFILKNNDMAIEDVKNAIEYDPSNTILYKQLVFLTIYKKFNTPSGWLEFAEKDIAKIIDDVYPDEMEKPTVDEFNDVTKR